VSDIAKKFYEWCEGKKPESDSAEVRKQVQVDGVAHNRQEQEKQADFKEAGRTNSKPRNEGVSGHFGRVELTEETPDGKIITHVKGVPAPDSEAQSAKLTVETSADAEPSRVRIGTVDYGADQVLAYDWEAAAKKVIDAGKLASGDKRFWELEVPGTFDFRFPRRGREDECVDYAACDKASGAFPDLKKYIGDQQGQVDPHLVAAIIRNEQFYYKNFYDTGPDHYAKAHGGWPYGSHQSIGPAQIQVGTIRFLAEKFPEVLELGQSAVNSAENIHHAPYFVTAYFATIIHGVEHNKKPDFISSDNWKQITEKWH
jgi:hypothetical protein